MSTPRGPRPPKFERDKCCVCGRTRARMKTEGTPTSFFRFPRSETYYCWMKLCNVPSHENMNFKALRICSHHFTKKDMVIGFGPPHLKYNAVPTIFEPYTPAPRKRSSRFPSSNKNKNRATAPKPPSNVPAPPIFHFVETSSQSPIIPNASLEIEPELMKSSDPLECDPIVTSSLTTPLFHFENLSKSPIRRSGSSVSLVIKCDPFETPSVDGCPDLGSANNDLTFVLRPESPRQMIDSPVDIKSEEGLSECEPINVDTWTWPDLVNSDDSTLLEPKTPPKTSPLCGFTPVSDATLEIAPETQSDTLECEAVSEEETYPELPTPRVQPPPPWGREPVCRVCGESGLTFIHLLGEEQGERELLRKVNSALPIQVKQDDGLPSQLCTECARRVEETFWLRDRAARTDATLRLAFLGPALTRAALTRALRKVPPSSSRSSFDAQPPCLEHGDAAGPADLSDSEELNLAQEDVTALSVYNPSEEEEESCDSMDSQSDSSHAPVDSCWDFIEQLSALGDAPFSETEQMQVDLIDVLEPPGESAAEDHYFLILPQPAVEDKTDSPPSPHPTPCASQEDSTPLSPHPKLYCTSSIPCVEDMKRFSTPQAFKDHQNSSHIRKVHVCSLCCVFFGKKSLHSLLDHWLDLHEDILSGDTPPPHPEIQHELAYVKKSLKQYLKPRGSVPRREYQCSMCPEKFRRYRDWLRHEQKEKRIKKRKKCSTCDISFNTRNDYIYHMDRVHGIKRYQCTYCKKQFRVKQCYKQHLNTHETIEADILCELCGEAFQTKAYLRAHVARRHNKFSCPYCDMKVPSTLRTRHLDRNHFEEKKFQCTTCFQSFFSETDMNGHQEKHSEGERECVICGLRQKMTQATLVSHIEKDHKNRATKRYTCPVTWCRNEVTSVDALFLHCSEHSTEELHPTPTPDGSGIKTLYCAHCDCSFRNMSIYVNHINNISEENDEVVMMCDLCKHQFINEQEITSHLESHPEAFNFWCRHCRQCFVSDVQRTEHERADHARYFRCKSCHLSFRSKHSIKRHEVKVHTDPKFHQSYTCEKCGKILCHKESLKKHIQYQHLRRIVHVCQECGKEFKIAADLRKHMFVHTRTPYHKCEVCGFSCHTATALDKHNKLKHTSDVVADMLCTT